LRVGNLYCGVGTREVMVDRRVCWGVNLDGVGELVEPAKTPVSISEAKELR